MMTSQRDERSREEPAAARASELADEPKASIGSTMDPSEASGP
jgi:hypothetical protein